MSGGRGGEVRVSIAGGLKKTIQDIREIAGEHSDEDIYAMLKECSMDPNETAQRLLHLDTFHEVKKKHGKKKENVGVKASDFTGKQRGARGGRGAKVGGGNFHSQNSSQINVRRSFGGSRENGFANMSKDHKSENKTTHKSSRSAHVKLNGKSFQDEAPQENSKYEDLSVPDDGGKPVSPDSVPPKQENVSSKENHVDSTVTVIELQTSAFVPSETVPIDAISPANLVHENHYAVSNGTANWAIDEPNGVTPHTEVVNSARSQPTVVNGNDQPSQAKGVSVNETIVSVEKLPTSEADLSVLNDEASKLNVSDGHVVFPEHLQVPEAYKKKLTFGSFGSSWPIGDKHTDDSCAASTDVLVVPAVDSGLVMTVIKSSIESSGNVSTTVKDIPEIETPTYIQSSLHIPNKMSPPLECASSDAVINEPKTESLLRNGGLDIAYHPSNHIFGYAPKPQLQAHDILEPQGGIFIAPSTSGVDRNSNIQLQLPVVTRDTVSSPPPGPFLRQTYYPNFSPYGHYYPQFFVPQVQQYVAHGGFPPQQPLVPNVYLTSPASGGIKCPHPQQKQGSNGGTDGYVGIPSGYNPYIPYTFPPYGLPPTSISGNVAGDEEQAAHLKENAALTTEQQNESSGEWMSGTGRTVSGLQINPLYNLSPGQGYPMVFPPTPTGFGPFGGVYHHPPVQAIPAPQPTVHPQHNHQPHSMGPAEPPPAVFYQQQPPPQGAHILRNNNKQSHILRGPN